MRPDPDQLARVALGEVFQDSCAPGCQPHADEAAIAGTVLLAHKPPARGALNQADDGVMLFLKEFGQFRDGSPAPPGVARHPEHQLVLLRGDSR